MRNSTSGARKLSVLLGEKTLQLVGDVAEANGQTKAQWARHLIRQRLREIAATAEAAA